jgi:DNA-binding transcriptional ArsR family regulator
VKTQPTITEQRRTTMGAAKLERAAAMLKAIAHPLRIQIIELLKGGKKLSVTEIYETLQIEQAIASQQLAILKEKDVLDSEKEGKNCYYFLKYQHIELIISSIEACQEC